MTTVANRNTMTATHEMGVMAHAMTTVEETMTVTDTMVVQRTITAGVKAMVTPTMAMVVDLPTAAMIGIGMMTDIVTGMMTGTMTAIGMENQDILAIRMERIEAEGFSLLLK
jgi:hypothetical protein